jgi:hypothetical protein
MMSFTFRRIHGGMEVAEIRHGRAVAIGWLVQRVVERIGHDSRQSLAVVRLIWSSDKADGGAKGEHSALHAFADQLADKHGKAEVNRSASNGAGGYRESAVGGHAAWLAAIGGSKNPSGMATP